MASRLSFAIAINLLTENFKRGTNQVKTALRSMQMQMLTFAAALGAGGLGLSNLVSRFIDVARETNRVTTALKNVSGGLGQFADNQRYLLGIAKKYGLEINALTGNFAKFTAAASISGMSMAQQRKIFESVSRACTAFGMSADDSNGVFLALSQMMSKGKISSEELRLQMGERLPIALQAMAKAAGVSVAGLDKLLKQGKLMSADVLPRFAEALNEMIPNVDTDNVETSVNNLKNAFTELVNGSNVQSKYKALIDWLTETIQNAANNIKSTIAYTITAILVMITSRLVNRIIAAISRAGLAAKVEARKAAKAAGVAFDEVAWKAQKTGASIKMAFTKILGNLKSLFISSIPTMLIAVVGGIVSGMVNASREAKRIKTIFSDYRAESKQATNTAEIINLQKQYKIASDLKRNLSERKGALSEINRQLNSNYSIDNKSLEIQGDLNKKVAERIELLKAAAEVDYLTRKKLETEDRINRLQIDSVKSIDVPTGGAFNPWNGPVGLKTLWNNFNPWNGSFGKIKSANDEISSLEAVLADVDARLDSATAKANMLGNTTNSNIDLDDDKKDKKTPLQKQQESYDKQFAELGAELEIGKITQAEYNKALADLNVKMYAQAKGANDKEVLESEYFKARKEAAEKAINDMPNLNAQVELEKVQKEYGDKMAELQGQLSKNIISQKEFNEKVVDLSVEASKSAASIKGIGNAADGFIGAMMVNATMLSVKKPKKEYDATFDYKKTAPEILSGKLEIAKEWRENAIEEAKRLGVEMTDELNKAIAEVTSLEDALKLAVVIEDIKNLNKELSESLYSGVKDIAGSADRVVGAFQNLHDIMNDVDATEWEKLMAIWNALTNVVDSFLSISRMIENITELTNKLTQAKESEAAIDTATTNTKVANAAKGTVADITAATVKKQTATEEVKANTAAGASEAGKGAAKLPFPWNIVAIGGAIAAAIAAFAAIPKFATGGIVTGGPTSGDKILARVNAGEMILNQGQQSRLFEAINSGRLGSTQNINIGFGRVRGADIELAINNDRKRRGKHPLS